MRGVFITLLLIYIYIETDCKRFDNYLPFKRFKHLFSYMNNGVFTRLAYRTHLVLKFNLGIDTKPHTRFAQLIFSVRFSPCNLI